MLSIREVVKQYAEHKALDQVSMEIKEGSIFGLLGPNGAGKTSLIRIINQITGPDSGEILFKGQKLNPTHISQIGYMPEERGLYKKMEIGEHVIYLARLKGMSSADATKQIEYWFEKLEIQSWWKKKVEELSKGMQQKVQFVATVVHNPPLIILDEPFSGLDPINAHIIENEMMELNKQGTTFIFSTHRLEAIETFCDSIALINKSKKILDGNVRDIQNSYRNGTYKIDFTGELPVMKAAFTDAFEIIENTDGRFSRHLVVKAKNSSTSNDLLQSLLPHIQILGMKEVIPSVSDIFISKVNEMNS